jgi:S-adenosylmethionine/arginine decarboxylase-like enzyme
VDIFTCGDHTAPAQACKYLVAALECKQSNIQIIMRGI